MDTSPLKNLLVGRLMPEKCYEELFVRFYWHAPCLKFVLNKIVGFWIILDTFLAQLPQLLRILWRGSAEGLSVASFLLQLYALSCPVVYAAANNFPFLEAAVDGFLYPFLKPSVFPVQNVDILVFKGASLTFEVAWADRLLMLAQTAAIVFLILHYRGETLKGVLLLFSFGGVMLLLSSYAGAAVPRLMYSSTVTAFILSKVVQTVANYHNGHTGQLSTLSVLLSCAGSLSAAIVSVQEDGGFFTTLSHILSPCLSFVLVAQVLCYKRNNGSAAKKME